MNILRSHIAHTIWLSFMLPLTLCAYKISFDQTNIDRTTSNIQMNIELDPQESIVKQTISISLDNPYAELGSIAYQPTAQKKYIPEFTSSKDVFENNVTITVPVQKKAESTGTTPMHLHVSFLTLPDNTMHEQIYQIALTSHETSNQPATDLPQHVPSSTTDHTGTCSEKKSITDMLQSLVQTTNSTWIRFLFAFLLGLLLSLTPCIYPMIPITIGVLHNNQKNSSVAAHFIGSLCYAFGLSTTFALLGLLAAFAGASFGSLLSQPLFVLALVAFIGYMSLTMIGVIELRLPSFLQRGTQLNSSFGPYLSAYLFGLISGSVASPCVSPGLALLLTIVATMGNTFAGFLLLFFFGIGMSVPLIIIGTFSSSLSLLPQAGQWMVEVKKALGFVMLATCLYYLGNILPSYALNWLIVAYFIFAALFYIIDAQKDFAPQQKTIKSLLGIVLLAIAVVMGMKAYDRMSGIHQEAEEQGTIWADNYEIALTSARAENKLILLDFWANHCTICKAIDKKIFKKDIVWQKLKDQIIFVKVDCTSSSNQEAQHLKNMFKVYAQPAILIVNPDTQDVIKKWSSEPYSMTPADFVDAVKKLIA